MVNTPCDGSGWWQVDLGGVYNLQRLIFWNRYPYVSANTTAGFAYGMSANGATISYFNNFGSPVGSYVLNGSAIQSIPVVLSPFTPTPSATLSLGSTASNTPSASLTMTPTATPPITQTQTATPTASLTAAVTPSTFPTTTPTTGVSPSVTQSAPLAPYAYKLTISTVAPNTVLNFIEAFVFTNTGQDVAYSGIGATSAWTAGAQYSNQANGYGHDLFCDPWDAAAANPQLMAGSAAAAAWTVTFPVTAQYPNGEAIPISQCEFLHALRVGVEREACCAHM